MEVYWRLVCYIVRTLPAGYTMDQHSGITIYISHIWIMFVSQSTGHYVDQPFIGRFELCYGLAMGNQRYKAYVGILCHDLPFLRAVAMLIHDVGRW